MDVKYAVLLVILLKMQLASVHCFGWAVIPSSTILGTTIYGTNEEMPFVEVHNEGKHHAHMWCASANDKVGGDDGLWVKPGEKVIWGFNKTQSTKFWCDMNWYGQRLNWDVFDTTWKDAPNPTKWSIRNDGVYDQWKNRKWRNLNS